MDGPLNLEYTDLNQGSEAAPNCYHAALTENEDESSVVCLNYATLFTSNNKLHLHLRECKPTVYCWSIEANRVIQVAGNHEHQELGDQKEQDKWPSQFSQALRDRSTMFQD